MGSVNTQVFWGVILLLWGISILLRVFLGISIPVMRLVIGSLLIYGGFLLVTGARSVQWQSQEWSTIDSQGCHFYNHYLTSGIIDLRNLPLHTGTQCVRVHSALSRTTLLLDPTIPTKVIIQASLAHISYMQNSNAYEKALFFGNRTFDPVDKQEPKIIIELAASLSTCVIKYEKI